MAGIDAQSMLVAHGDGADTSTTIVDSSPYVHTLTRAGNVQIDTGQSKFGGASIQFDGTGDFLTLDGSADFAFGAGDFAVDFWFRLVAAATDYALYDSRPTSTNGAYLQIYIDSATSKLIASSNSGGVSVTSSTTMSNNTWRHCAVTRSGTSLRLFIDGTQEGGTQTDSTTYLNGTSRPAIGALGYDTGLFNLNGWIDELRVSKGNARWTANFTPPTAAYSLDAGIPIFKKPTRIFRRSF